MPNLLLFLLCAWLEKDQRVFSVVVAIYICGALMPRATILFSQTNMQSRHILFQPFLSQSGTDITNFHVLILLCHVLPNTILCHFRGRVVKGVGHLDHG